MARRRNTDERAPRKAAIPTWVLVYREADWLPKVGPAPEDWGHGRPWPEICAASLWSEARRRWVREHRPDLTRQELWDLSKARRESLGIGVRAN